MKHEDFEKILGVKMNKYTGPVEVYDLPESELKKSATWRRYADDCGTCSRCHEHSGVLDYCCTGVINFEGGSIDSNQLWEEIEAELKEDAESKAYDLAEAEMKGN